MRTPLLAAAAAAALFVCGPVAASTAAATAAIQGLQVQLFDLDPSDGIAPSIAFLGGGLGANNGSAQANWSRPDSTGSAAGTFQSDGGPWKPGSTSAVTTFVQAQAALSGNNTASGSTLAASGTASSPGDYAYPPSGWPSVPGASFNAWVTAPAWNVSFMISANTVAVFSATAIVSAQAIEGGAVTYDFGDGYPFTSYWGNSASASGSIGVSGPAAGGGTGNQSASDGRSVYASSNFDTWAGRWINQSQSSSGPIGVTFLNLTGGSMNGNLQLSVNAYGNAFGSSAPIPEPGTWALLLAGLGVIGRIAARARRD